MSEQQNALGSAMIRSIILGFLIGFAVMGFARQAPQGAPAAAVKAGADVSMGSGWGKPAGWRLQSATPAGGDPADGESFSPARA